MDVLIDSAVYIDHLRAGIDIRELLLPWLHTGTLWNCGVVRAEVLRGLKNPKVRDLYQDFFDIVPEVPTDAKMWHEITHLAWQLDRTGAVLPLTDVAIACCAQRVGATVISPDQHFEEIPSLPLRKKLPDPFS